MVAENPCIWALTIWWVYSASLIHNKQIKIRDNFKPRNTVPNSSRSCEFTANSIHAQGANSHTRKSHHKCLESCATAKVHTGTIKSERRVHREIQSMMSSGKVQNKDNVDEGRSLTCICGPISFPRCVRTMSLTEFNLRPASGSKHS